MEAKALKKRIRFRYILAVAALMLVCFVGINHKRFWGGVLNDSMTKAEQEHAAATFDFNYYYSYDAALSDLSRIFSGRDKAFIDKVLTQQASYISHPIGTSRCKEGKNDCISYLYHFHHLYLYPGFIYSTGDTLYIELNKQGQPNNIGLVHLDDLGSVLIKKKVRI